MLNLKTNHFFSVILLTGIVFVSCGSKKENSGGPDQYKKGRLLYADDFSDGLKQWVPEVENKPGSYVKVEDGKMIADVQGGATIWFRHELQGNILIEFTRAVIINGGPNDRLSDMNMFWMATDPNNDTLFTRNGVFARYHPLLLYYAGIGGNTNSTTRFRKYDGTGNRILYTDYSDEAHLLKPNKTYKIQIVVYNGTTKLFQDGEMYFSFADDDPLTEGYFGFRLVKSHQTMDDFKVYRLKE
ncbi:DUF6250 domain-containing protein [Saccharicrinis sp. FJH62]|uniref:DUF6250 domain-containing protein n=1 Tax=Saccharicrinis sp. FJH62 TaxID=3344657 RepID=UPI0035D506BE